MELKFGDHAPRPDTKAVRAVRIRVILIVATIVGAIAAITIALPEFWITVFRWALRLR